MLGLEQLEPKHLLSGGEGQTIAVIDSGIAHDHVQLSSNYVGGFDFAEGDQNPYDDGPAGGNGTHVAGIIKQVAPSADIVSLRVFDDNGGSNVAWVKQALQWVHDNRNSFTHPITAVNLSLVMTDTADLEAELSQLQADGIFVAASAGNNFTQLNNTTVGYPASSVYVVPAMSLDADGNLSYFSQRNGQGLAAPGRHIVSAVPDYLGNANGVVDDTKELSGTSQATPHLVAAATVLRETLVANGAIDITPTLLTQKLRDSAVDVFDPQTNATYKKVDLAAALAAETDTYVLTQNTADTEIRGDSLNPLQAVRNWDEGGMSIFRVGRRPPGGPTDEIYRGLLKFDLSALPPNVEIVSAQIELSGGTGDPAQDTLHSAPVSIYQVVRPWGEGNGLGGETPTTGESSWLSAMHPTLWSVPGASGASDTDANADRKATPIATQTATSDPANLGIKTVWESADLTNLVQAWVDNPSQNQGVFLKAVDETFRKTINFCSSEHTNPDFHPKLVVSVRTTPPNPPPVAVDDAFTVPRGSDPVDLDVTQNDTSDPGEILNVIAVGAGSAGGTILLNPGVSYQPAVGFVGTEEFTYTINDGIPGNDATAIVRVVVEPYITPAIQEAIQRLRDKINSTNQDLLQLQIQLDAMEEDLNGLEQLILDNM